MRSSALVLVLLMLGAVDARAEALGGSEPSIVMFRARFAIAPAPGEAPAGGEQLGLDLQVRALSFGWGRGALRHRIEVSAIEAPEWGDPEQQFFHFGRYDLAWRGDGLALRGGVRALSLWSGELRVATPVVGVQLAPFPRAQLEVELELSGLFAASLRDTRPSARRDVAVEVRAAWPADARTRGELRLRARDYTIAPDPDEMEVERRIRDVTLTAGVGLALAARDRMRAVPGFLGLALRATDGAGTAALVVAELAIGVD
ncbi:MAG: hypothetical protein KF773_02415 [Deltaproteobacteria bacterium]|nr:hypothetical protein [Deltaproteobacteria bacterium]